ncbi:hypothetical protein CORT_0B04600, partial [Candida orthopsilosis Co 90-125]
MSSDKSEDISNNSIERDNDTFMEEREPTAQHRLVVNSDSSATPVYADGGQEAVQPSSKVLSHNEKHPDPVSQKSAPSPPPQHVSFFSKEYKPYRIQIHKRFLLINLLMTASILAVFSIYWGSYYDISDNLKELKMLVVIGDEHTVDGVSPVFGNAMEEILQRPQAKASG